MGHELYNKNVMGQNMKKLILPILLLILSAKSAFAIDFVFPVGKNYYFGRQNVPASNQLSVRMFASCGSSINDRNILTSQSYNQFDWSLASCPAGSTVNVRAFNITNTAPKTPCKSHLFKMNYMVALVDFPDGPESQQIRQGTGWQIRSSNLPETNVVMSGASQGYVVIDRDIEYLGESASQIYETSSGIRYYQGVQEYRISYFGYTYPLDGCADATSNHINLGNQGSDSNAILSLRTPDYVEGNGVGPTMFVQKPQIVLVDPDTLQATDIQSIVTQLQNLRTESSADTTREINNAIAIAQSQEQAAQQRQEELLNDDTQDSESELSSFMTSFEDELDTSLSSIVTAPIRFAQSLVGTSCQPLSLPLPIVNTNLSLPCPRQLMSQNFPELLRIYDVVTCGLISYALALHILQIINTAKNPDSAAKMEIMEL